MVTKQELLDFEEWTKDAFLNKQIHSPIHLSKGNEDQLIEIFKNVKSEDIVFSTHRSHYHALLKGIPTQWLKDEMLANHSIHVFNKEHNFFSSAIVGGCLPIAVGVAMGIKLKGQTNRVFVFCVPEGTKILMRRNKKYYNHFGTAVSVQCVGSEEIENIKVGDSVLSYNEKDGKKEFKRVNKIFRRKANQFIILKFNNGNELKLTPEHPVAVDRNGKIYWMSAASVSVGDNCIQYKYGGLHYRIDRLAGKSFDEMFGSDHANKLRQASSKRIAIYNSSWNGKSYEDRYGLDKANEVHHTLVEAQKNNNLDPTSKHSRMTAIFQSLKEKPNLLEKKMIALLDEICPNEFEYDGDGRLNINFGGIFPDFVDINGKKKIIETFSRYWKERDYGSVDNYTKICHKQFMKHGISDILFVEDVEFKNKCELSNKILSFVYNPHAYITKVIDKQEVIETEDIEVYNLEVEDNNNFFAYGILVHNCGDMAAETGAFNECCKYSHGHDLPITFIIEDNGFSTDAPTKKVWGYNYRHLHKVMKYSYQRGYPHVGAGEWVQF